MGPKRSNNRNSKNKSRKHDESIAAPPASLITTQNTQGVQMEPLSSLSADQFENASLKQKRNDTQDEAASALEVVAVVDGDGAVSSASNTHAQDAASSDTANQDTKTTAGKELDGHQLACIEKRIMAIPLTCLVVASIIN